MFSFRNACWLAGLLVFWLPLSSTSGPASFHFAILGDRTGEALPGVYEQVWREVAAEDPAFVISVGDTIQGFNDASADAEWQEVRRILAPYRRIPLFLAPGNHDIWSEQSRDLFERYAAHPLHYSFDFRQAHFTILDNSRTDQFSAGELAYLEKDLREHALQPVKFLISHRPSWLLEAMLGNPGFAIHRLARKYGVRYVIAGHLHEMLRFDLEGVTYLSMASSGGHLRGSRKYEDGWFFQHTRVDVEGKEVRFRIEELTPPHGNGRSTSPRDWGGFGLIDQTVRGHVGAAH